MGDAIPSATLSWVFCSKTTVPRNEHLPLGVTLEGVAALEKVEEMGGPSWSDPNGLPPFTRTAMRVMNPCATPGGC